MQLNIMHLNAENCFNPPRPGILSIKDCYTPWFWLSRLKSELARRNISKPVSGIDNHLGLINIYRHKADLYRCLQIIYSLLADSYKDINNPPVQLSEDQKQAIALKVNEGIFVCTEGFHNRLLEIINSFNHLQSLEDILGAIRGDIVRISARDFIWNNHTYNRFFNVAHNEGLAVTTINLNDRGVCQTNDEVIKAQLTETFIHHYRPFEILQRCHEYIISELATQGYQGRLVRGSYDYQAYRRFICTLQRLLTDGTAMMDNHFRYLLEINDNYEVIDINWLNVTLELWRYFNRNDYFIYNDHQQSAFENLLNAQISSERSLARAFHHYDDLKAACQLASHSGNNQKLNLFTTFKQQTTDVVDLKLFTRFLMDLDIPIDTETCKIAKQLFPKLNYQDQWPKLSLIDSFTQAKESINLCTAITNIGIFVDQSRHNTILTETDHNGNQILHLAAKQNTDAVKLLLQLMRYNDSLNQANLFTSVNQSLNNPLMKAIKFNPKASKLILNASLTLSEHNQFTMLAQTNDYRNNVVMLAIQQGRKESLTILRNIQNLNSIEQYNILQHTNNDQNNSLMLAASLYPPVFKAILNAISALDKHKISTILGQHNHMNENVLMIAAKHNRQLVLPIIDSLSQLNTEQQNKILTKTIDHMNNSSADTGYALFPAILLVANTLSNDSYGQVKNCLLAACTQYGTQWLRERLVDLSDNGHKAGNILQSLAVIKQYDQLFIELVQTHNHLNEPKQTLQSLCRNPATVDELINQDSSYNKAKLFKIYRENCQPVSFKNVFNQLCEQFSQAQMDQIFHYMGLPTTRIYHWFQKTQAMLTNQKTPVQILELDEQKQNSPQLDRFIDQHYPFWRDNNIASDDNYELQI